jgi:hypothetical protein
MAQEVLAKCIEERGCAFLHLLSPRMHIASSFCLLCWRMKPPCSDPREAFLLLHVLVGLSLQSVDPLLTSF